MAQQEWNYLDLAKIRATLIRQEDTILFHLIERAQFKRNPCVYQEGAQFLEGTGIEGSYAQHLLKETETIHSRARRYTSPDEKPFTPVVELPASTLPPLIVPENMKYLQSIDVNINPKLYGLYSTKIINEICKEGDDGQYGSAAVCDILTLQALSKRIHYGTFVAESKFISQPEEYTRLIKAGDRDGIMALLTNSEVEERVIKRVQRKATAYGQEITDEDSQVHGPALTEEELKYFKVNPEVMGRLYRDMIIPLTKEVEVDYLMQRAS
ncbi:chorismate mutase [Baffinella frigidus]|nr:chorismate mutase [Cryptophyta sp. CCMP2293]|mmetsp:Transcript_62398/g.142917  ORF Transcript_62398/g.142917 Transcript_62398/m.142917 type:complete len:268 (-) Transcript_62398:185-988(-)